MSVCVKLTELTEDTFVLTKELIGELLVSTYDRTVGTNVEVECRDGYYLIGPSVVECQSNRMWSASPYCSDTPDTTPDTTPPTVSGTASDELSLIIGGTVGGALVLAVIVFLIVVLCLGRRRDKFRYREPEPYRDDRSYRPYSISGKRPTDDHIPMYNMHSNLPMSPVYQHQTSPSEYKPHNYIDDRVPDRDFCHTCRYCHGRAPPRRKVDHCDHCESCHRCKTPRLQQPEVSRQIDIVSCSECVPDRDFCHNCRHCHEPTPSRREAHHCDHCKSCHRCETPRLQQPEVSRQLDSVQRIKPVRRSGSANDVRDVVVRRDIIREQDDDDRYIGDQNRDVYLWRSMYNAGWTIPRPFYDS